MPSHTQDAPAKSESGAPTYTLRDIPLSHLVVSQNNPRKQFDEDELARLAHAMSTRGFDHPILVKPAAGEDCYEIIDGERRWRAATVAGVETIPALVKTRRSVPGDDLLDAMLANGLGISLDVLEEALGYQTLISEHGYNRKGIAEAFQIPQARVRERLLILDLPEKVRHQVAAGLVPLVAVKTLASLAKLHAGLPEVAVKRVLDGPMQEWDEPRTWDDLVADPISVVIGDYQEQLADLPGDVFAAGTGYPVGSFDLDAKALKRLASLCELLQIEPERFSVRFDRELLDQALALSAAQLSANESEAIIIGADVGCQLAGDYISKCLTVQRKNAKAEREADRRAEARQDSLGEGVDADAAAGDTDDAAVQPPSYEQIEAGRKRALEEDRRLRDETIAANQRLGAALFKHFGRVKLDDRVLKILTAAPLSADLGRIAARGARLAFPGWTELSTRKNGSTKAEYLGFSEAEGKARAFLLGAQTATEIAGRALALLAAARWAREKWAVPNSDASHYTLQLGSFMREHGMPWRNEADDLLDDILLEKLPPEVSGPIREAKERREAERAKEARRERERDGVVAEFIERAPTLTCDERHAEIARLRREYGFSALPHEQGRKLMELPEPGASTDAAEPEAPEHDAEADDTVELAAAA
ncbi:MAG: ParB/RepB/Spo0J family partition protein [Solirubrobacterales bacterium]